jgi:hypothetical protein|tara:strand:+ start:116 stop:256 length:141 start_codon:yes stop_codon:yes gene_type:complete
MSNKEKSKQEDSEANQNLVSFFKLLEKVDRNNNPSSYKEKVLKIEQ